MAKERHREKEKKRDRKAETLNHLSIHQWVRSAIFAPHQLTSPIGFPFLKLPPPPCAALLVLMICISKINGCSEKMDDTDLTIYIHFFSQKRAHLQKSLRFALSRLHQFPAVAVKAAQLLSMPCAGWMPARNIYISSWVLYSLFPSFFERPWQLRGVLLPLEMRLNCFLQVIPTNWHFICILSGILCGKYSAISSDLLCDRYCDILADNLSGIFSGILSGIYAAMFSDIYFDNLLHIDIYSGSLALFYLALHLAVYLSFLKILSDIWLTFYLTSYSDILTFYPTFVWHSVRVGARAQAVQLPSWSGSATSKILRCWKFHIHLVGGIPTPLKNMKVNGKDDIPYMKWKIKKCSNSKPPTSHHILDFTIHQIDIFRTEWGRGWTKIPQFDDFSSGKPPSFFGWEPPFII